MQEKSLVDQMLKNNRLFIGTKHSLLAIKCHKEFRTFFRAKGDDEFAYLKFGSTPAMQARCLIDSSGDFYEFRPNGLVRSWASVAAPIHDITLQICIQTRHNHLKAKDLSQLLKKNISDLDRHFPTTMKVYKFLSKMGSEEYFDNDAFLRLWQSIYGQIA